MHLRFFFTDPLPRPDLLNMCNVCTACCMQAEYAQLFASWKENPDSVDAKAVLSNVDNKRRKLMHVPEGPVGDSARRPGETFNHRAQSISSAQTAGNARVHSSRQFDSGAAGAAAVSNRQADHCD